MIGYYSHGYENLTWPTQVSNWDSNDLLVAGDWLNLKCFDCLSTLTDNQYFVI